MDRFFSQGSLEMNSAFTFLPSTAIPVTHLCDLLMLWDCARQI